MENKRPFGTRDKFGYLFGDFGNDFFFMLVLAFLMVFYTDVLHLDPKAVGLLFVVARLWDAFADMAWGRFIDTRKTGKNGKFRPWILRMSFPLVITGVLMFAYIPGMSHGFYLAYAYVTYIVWGTLYSTVNIPYGSMASVMSADPVERTALSSWRTVGSQLAGLVINVVGPIILFVDNKAVPSRFFMAALIFGLLAIACYIACYRMTTERIIVNEKAKSKVKKGATLKGLVKNKPLIFFLAASLIFMVNLMLIGAVNVYLFKDYFGTAKALSFVGLIQSAAVFVMAPFIHKLVKKFGKKELVSVSILVAGLVYVALYLLPNLSATQFTALLAIAMLGYGTFNLVIWAFVTDIIDYHEYLTGLREDGTIYAIYSMARKIGQAVAGGVGAAAIAAVGYNSQLEVQTAETLRGIHMVGTLIPAIVFLSVFVIITFLYPLNKKRTEQLAADLSEKRQAAVSGKTA
ncbi:MFS transporter [Neobacillus niacini]|uniref:MFS transporter n=1 Tax=Neobacillus niacini TaxID=86668 RepID=UPI0021CB3C86|nr:glycoside-pentoside-hexuronide (GPH):cation symporter [Neobacillus niacini]MCM3768239.1 glycoside-pentoside-hexuronide (GPH):cation symporter [Neobacillus niacini]